MTKQEAEVGVGRPGRRYPPPPERKRILDVLSQVADDRKSPLDWYSYGSVLSYEGADRGDQNTLKLGLVALERAAAAQPPAPEAAEELAWFRTKLKG